MQELVPWKDKQNQEAFQQAHQEEKREDPIKRIRNERGEITTDTTEIPRIVRNYHEELYAKKFENLGDIDKFLEKNNVPKLNEDKQKAWTDQ